MTGSAFDLLGVALLAGALTRSAVQRLAGFGLLPALRLRRIVGSGLGRRDGGERGDGRKCGKD
jgi:hypothetical protein